LTENFRFNRFDRGHGRTLYAWLLRLTLYLELSMATAHSGDGDMLSVR